MEKYMIKYTEINIESLLNLGLGIVNVNYSIGAANDRMPTGSVHFLEHVVCSTQRLLPGKLTAQTQRDETNYYLYVQRNNLHKIFNDLNWEISINENIIEHERNIIKKEVDQFNLNPRHRALEYLQFLLFNGEGYGKSILGNENQIEEINKIELERGLEYYKTPSSINVIGPWEKDYIIDCINNSNIIKNFNVSSYINPITIGSGSKSLSKDYLNIPFVGGAWFLNLDKSAQIYIRVLKSVWEKRIRKIYPEVPFNVRIHLYNHGGILTLDSTSLKADKTNIESIISYLETPINLQEFKKAMIRLYIDHHRLSEDLQSRIYCQNISDFQSLSTITLEDTLKYQGIIINNISKKTGVYLLFNSESPNNICYVPIKKIYNSKLNEEKNLKFSNNGKEKKESKKGNNKLLLKSSKREFYYTLTSSPLIKRYHVLFRIDCKGIGRLLLPNELPPEISLQGTLENVRYEGWHTLYQIAFFDENSMKNSVINSLSYNWVFVNRNESTYEEYYTKNLEVEMKWRILKAFNTSTKKNNKGKIIGISIITPERSSIEDGHLENLCCEENIQTPLSIQENTTIIENKRIPARFDGSAVICCLPKQSLCALVLQEAAFGTNSSFPTLESLTRERGLSYRIVQSLICVENELYIFWGIQCDPDNTTLFKDIVIEWIVSLEDYSDQIEKWFKQMWVYFNPQKHSSILQLIRDVDRMGQYTQPTFDTRINFKTFINKVMMEELIDITFTKE